MHFRGRNVMHLGSVWTRIIHLTYERGRDRWQHYNKNKHGGEDGGADRDHGVDDHRWCLELIGECGPHDTVSCWGLQVAGYAAGWIRSVRNTPGKL